MGEAKTLKSQSDRAMEGSEAVLKEAASIETSAREKVKNLELEKESFLKESLTLKQDRTQLTEWENKLRVWEKTLENDSAKRKRDLDDREARIKELEAQLGR